MKDLLLEKLDELGYIVISPETNSMSPLIRPRKDHVVFRKKERIEKNDIVLFRSPYKTKLVMHRVIKAFEDTFEIRGDNSNYSETVSKENVFAVATEIYRGEKHYTCDSLTYRFLSSYFINYNKLCFVYRHSPSLFWRIVRKFKRFLF